MATTITKLAIDNADLLRALKVGTFTTNPALAEHIGRDVSNVRKSLIALHAAKLINATSAAADLTPSGEVMVAALDRADGIAGQSHPASAGDMPQGFAQLILLQIEPDPLNPRKHFDPEAIEELADSILKDGLLENLVVRPGELPDAEEGVLTGPDGPLPIHRLVAGERRWRAMKRLMERSDWAKDTPIMCRVVDLDDAGHRRVALVENLQRKDLRPIDEAQALKELMAVTGQGTAEIAAEIGFTQRFVQQRLQLLELPPIKQVELQEGKLTIEAARQWLAGRPKPLEGLTAEQELALLEVGWAIAAKSNNYWTSIDCDHLVPRDLPNLFQVNRNWQNDCRTVRLTSAGYDHLRAISGADDSLVRAGLEPALRKARVLAIGGSPLSADHDPHAFKKVDALFKEKRNVTPWLNAPFRPDPVWAEEKAQREAENAAWHAGQAERTAERMREQAERKARADGAEARSIAAVRAFESKTWSAAAIEDAVAWTDFPLPWRFVEGNDDRDYAIFAANGKEVDFWDGGPPLLRLLMCALNAAADLPPQLIAADQRDVTEESDDTDGDDAAAPAEEAA